MYFAIFASDKPGMLQVRNEQRDAFSAYLHDHPDHPDVIFHHGGPTLDDDGETVVGLLLVIEAPSLETARAFLRDSPFAKADLFEEIEVRPWQWTTGRPG